MLDVTVPDGVGAGGLRARTLDPGAAALSVSDLDKKFKLWRTGRGGHNLAHAPCTD